MLETVFPASLLGWACLAFLVAYLICAIPFGLIISLVNGVDVRTVGSGNIGTTNVARSVGKGASALTLVFDAGKGALSIVLARMFVPTLAQVDPASIEPFAPTGWVLSGVYLACVLGHVFTPYLHFHGGKGIAVGFGGALALHWPLALGILAVFLCVAIPTKYVSLSSIAAGLSLTVLAAVMGFSVPALVPVAIVSLLVVWAHRENIDRLRRHEEKRFSFHKEES